ncbi:CARDB domain-containing protein, partial [Stieleria sp.]|uniref:CARDB domain-containing protein n=1 Tax=Stieleria sp. TaxID=2795976 RepID=UPI003568721F
RVRELNVATDQPIVGGQKVSLNWVVDNIGTVATDRESWADAVYLSEDDVFDSGDQLVFAIPHDGRLQPGDDYRHDVEFTLPPSAKGSHFFVQTNVDPRIALTEEAKFLEEVAAVLKRIEAATGKPIGETEIGDLKQFSRSELLAILAGPTNTLVQVYEGPFTDNNVGSVEATVVDAIADLLVENVTATPTSKSGEPITVSWTVRNAGDSATNEVTQSIKQYVYLSKDPVFDASRAILVGSPTKVLNGPIAVDGSYNASMVVSSPPGSSGNWYAHVFANVGLFRGKPVLTAFSKSGFPDWPRHFVDKTWEAGRKSDNFASSQIIAIEYAEPNLVISNLSAVPTSPDSGSLMDVSFTVTNSGTRATRVDQWTDRVFLSTDTSTDAYDIELGTFRRNNVLGIGESYEVALQVRLSNNIGGEFHVIAQTDATFADRSAALYSLPYPIAEGWPRLRGVANKVLEFNDEGDNQTSVQLDVQFVPAPDLVIDSVDFVNPSNPSSNVVEVGNDFTFTYTYTNDGGVIPDSQVPFVDRVYLSRDRLLDVSSDHFVKQIVRGETLAPGQTGTITETARLPRGITGDYFIIVATDFPNAYRPDGEVIETNETNNITVAATPILIVQPPPSDLQVIDISAPTSGSVGDVLSVSWTVENRGDEQARARIADAVYLSADSQWDIGDRFLGRVESASVRTLQPGDSYSASLDFEVPVVLPDGYRIIVRTDIFDDVVEGENNRNNASASADEVNITVPLLRLDIPLEDQLAVGVSRLFQLDVSPGQTIRVDLDSTTGIGRHELYAAHERLPSPFDFDAAYEGYLSADQSMIIPETLGGRYFVLARGGVRIDVEENDPRGRSEYPVTMNATRLPFGITDVTPDSGGDDRYVTVTIRGAEFPQQAAVRLVRPTLAEFAPVSVSRIDATKIVAVFDLRDAPHGLYDIQVLHPDGRLAVDPYRFQVESADALEVNVGVGGPSQIDLGATGGYGFAVQNLANVDTPYTLLEYAFPNAPNRRPDLIPGPAIEFASGLRGDALTVAPLFDSISTFDFSSVVPELNLSGVLTARGVAIDLPNQGVTEVGSAVTIYPGLREILETDPDFLKELSPFELDDLGFDFYVAAAATPMTADEYLDYQRDEAAKLRGAILADQIDVENAEDSTNLFLRRAHSALVSIAGDAESFTSLYLQALADSGLLRPEDTPPIADGKAEN